MRQKLVVQILSFGISKEDTFRNIMAIVMFSLMALSLVTLGGSGVNSAPFVDSLGWEGLIPTILFGLIVYNQEKFGIMKR